MNKPNNEWQLQDAKNKLSQLVKEAAKGVPQVITVHGKRAAVVISADEYLEQTKPRTKLSAELCAPILSKDDTLFDRHQDTGRDIEL